MRVYLLSYDRPRYLARVLKSLRRQSVDDLRLHVFQDGPRDRDDRAESGRIARCLALVRRIVPAASVTVAERNLGIGFNMLAAQDDAFLIHGESVAYFLEDDLVLNRDYLRQLQLLAAALAPFRDAAPYFSAYGDIGRPDHIAPLAVSDGLRLIDHFWAYGLFADYWARERRMLRPYFDLIAGVDYRRRDHAAIRSLFAAMGCPHPGSGQDAARLVGLMAGGRVGLTTRQPLARYIGSDGTNFTPSIFRDLGYRRGRVTWFARARAVTITADDIAAAQAIQARRRAELAQTAG